MCLINILLVKFLISFSCWFDTVEWIITNIASCENITEQLSEKTDIYVRIYNYLNVHNVREDYVLLIWPVKRKYAIYFYTTF